MKDAMTYKGYAGSVHYSEADHVLHGRVLGIGDVISYEGESVEDVEAAFREAVDDYLAWCEERGKTPERAYSGNLRLRLPEPVHRALDAASEITGESINALVVQAVRQLAPVQDALDATPPAPKDRTDSGGKRNGGQRKSNRRKASA